MASIAAADQDQLTTGHHMNAKGNLDEPFHPVYLQVTRRYAVAILGVIPTLQLIILIIVLAYANKGTVKGDSSLATAKLLFPIISKLGDRGCLLTGDELTQILGKDEPRLSYGSVFKGDTQGKASVETCHVGLFEEG